MPASPLDRMRRVVWLRKLWSAQSLFAPLATVLCRWCSSREDWSRIWYCLSFSALRGAIPLSAAERTLTCLGPCLSTGAHQPQSSSPPLWWALASRQDSSQSDLSPLLKWFASQEIALSGRFVGYDFLIASLRAGNRQAFAWGLSCGLPPDGCEVLDEEETSALRYSPIQSDLRTPLWHAVDSSTLSDPWWVDTLLAAGARWDYAGQGGASAADLDRDRAIGWSAWWRKNRLTQQVDSCPPQGGRRRM